MPRCNGYSHQKYLGSTDILTRNACLLALGQRITSPVLFQPNNGNTITANRPAYSPGRGRIATAVGRASGRRVGPAAGRTTTEVTRLLYHFLVLRLLHKILRCVCARDIHHDTYFLVRAQDVPTANQMKIEPVLRIGS